MPEFNLTEWLISVGSGYGRRIMEPYYDKIAQTSFFQALKRNDQASKYAVEAATNALAAFLDQKVEATTPFRKVLKEIFMDSASELNKRILNGESPKKILLEKSPEMEAVEEDFLAVILTMEEERIKPFLDWVFAMEEDQRKETLELLRKLSGVKIENILEMSPETRDMVLKLMKDARPAKKKNETLEAINDILRQRLEKRRVKNV